MGASGSCSVAMFSYFLKGAVFVRARIVRARLFLFGLPNDWQSASSGVGTVWDPSQESQTGVFGNDGDDCDATAGQSCGELIKNNVRAEGIHNGLFVGSNNYPSSGGKN